MKTDPGGGASGMASEHTTSQRTPLFRKDDRFDLNGHRVDCQLQDGRERSRRSRVTEKTDDISGQHSDPEHAASTTNIVHLAT